MSSTDLWIFRRSPQSLTRKPYIVPSAEVSVLGIDLDAIGAASLGVATILLLVFLSLWNQGFGLVVWIPADPVQEGNAVSHRHTNLPQAEALRARAPNSTAALALPRTMGRKCL